MPSVASASFANAARAHLERRSSGCHVEGSELHHSRAEERVVARCWTCLRRCSRDAMMLQQKATDDGMKHEGEELPRRPACLQQLPHRDPMKRGRRALCGPERGSAAAPQGERGPRNLCSTVAEGECPAAAADASCLEQVSRMKLFACLENAASNHTPYKSVLLGREKVKYKSRTVAWCQQYHPTERMKRERRNPLALTITRTRAADDEMSATQCRCNHTQAQEHHRHIINRYHHMDLRCRRVRDEKMAA